MKLAVNAVLVDGKPKKTAAKQFGIPRQTLQNSVKRLLATDGGVEKLHAGRPTTLAQEQENELEQVLLSMANRLFGLSPKIVRELVI